MSPSLNTVILYYIEFLTSGWTVYVLWQACGGQRTTFEVISLLPPWEALEWKSGLQAWQQVLLPPKHLAGSLFVPY